MQAIRTFYGYCLFFSLSLFVTSASAQSCGAAKSCPPTSSQACSVPPPVNQASVIGHWEGHFTYAGKLQPFQIDIRQEGDKLIAEGRLDVFRIKTSKFTTWMCRSNEIHMRLDLADQRVIKLIGTPSKGQLNGRVVYYPSPKAETVREVFALNKAVF